MGEKRIGIVGLAVLTTFLWLLPSAAFSQSDCNVSITPPGGTTTNYPNVQSAINAVTNPYTIITVSGTCNENLFISELKDYISLIGPATIIGRLDIVGQVDNGKRPVIQTIGKGTRIQNLTIRGGLDGIQVIRGGTAFIEDNVIESNRRTGITLAMNSYAHIINNMIQNNVADGIVVADNSIARIGVLTHDDTEAAANTIQGNEYGVTVARSSSALIVGNTINQNTYDGIRVAKVSQADISDNTINANGRFGILVTQNSGVNLGKDTGTGIFEAFNKTTAGNIEKGLSCSIGGYADGRLGTLNGVGARNQTSFSRDCINSLIP